MISCEGFGVVGSFVMANFLSAEFPSAFYNVGGTRDTLEGGLWRFSVGSTLLARVQRILILWAATIGPASGWTIDVYRRGGPLGAPATTIDLRLLAVDRDHGPITNGALWAYAAKAAMPTANWSDVIDGAIPDAGTRNALDKIEESLSSGMLTETAARVMLWVVERKRDPSLTWARFIAEQTPDFQRPLWQPYALRRALPLATTPAGLMILDTDQPASVDTLFVVSLTHCLRIGSSLTAEEIRRRCSAVVPPTMGRWLGTHPRITRTYAGLLEPCQERVRARWPLLVSLPNPAVYAGSRERFAESLTDAIRAAMPDQNEWEVSVTLYDIATNGAVDLWSSGANANTATRDTPTAGVEENPDGPSTLRPREEGTADKIVAALGTVATGAAVASGFWFGAKLLGAFGTSKTITTKREVEVLTKPRANKPRKR